MIKSNPLLIMFLGYPGSGKSYFARRLSNKINAVRLNGDSMRIAIFETVEAIEEHTDKETMHKQTFGAIDYAVTEILKVGYSVVYDAHHNRRDIREGLEKLADKYDAVPVVVWIKTPYQTALVRGQLREIAADSRRLSEEKMLESMNRHMAKFDEPLETEKIITIDGTIPFKQQYESFNHQLKPLVG